MNILTIDTSYHCIVGMCERDGLRINELARQESADTRHHTELLTPMVARVCEETGIQRPDVVVVGTGPAAFTGLRAGIVTARTLAFGWNIPVVGVSSLEVLAVDASLAGVNLAIPVIDARRKELFVMHTRAMGEADVEVLDGPSISRPHDLGEYRASHEGVLCTPHPPLYPELADAQHAQCSPRAMAMLALSRMARSQAG